LRIKGNQTTGINGAVIEFAYFWRRSLSSLGAEKIPCPYAINGEQKLASP
jgi:hypothetical protein